MHDDRILRTTLWISAFYNLGGAFLFARPQSPLGQLVQLPVPVPGVYSAMLAWFVLLFAGMYFWLALQPAIVRPMVALAAIGKAGAFALLAAFWLAGGLSGLAVLSASGDLVLAFVFTWRLLGTTELSSPAPVTRRQQPQ